MENNQEGTLLEMELDQNGGQILRDTARWSRFLSIVFFIGLALMLLIAAVASTMLATVFSKLAPGLDTLGSLGSAVFISAALIGCAIFGSMAYMLYRFSVLTRKGIEQQDQAAFSLGIRSLKIYFIISGVLAILSLLSNLYSFTKIFHS